MNIKLYPGDKCKKVIKLIKRDKPGKMSFTCRFEVKEYITDEKKIIEIIKERGEKHSLEYDKSDINMAFYVNYLNEK